MRKCRIEGVPDLTISVGVFGGEINQDRKRHDWLQIKSKYLSSYHPTSQASVFKNDSNVTSIHAASLAYSHFTEIFKNSPEVKIRQKTVDAPKERRKLAGPK